MNQLHLMSEEAGAELDEATSELSLVTAAQFLEDVVYSRAPLCCQTPKLGLHD